MCKSKASKLPQQSRLGMGQPTLRQHSRDINDIIVSIRIKLENILFSENIHRLCV